MNQPRSNNISKSRNSSFPKANHQILAQQVRLVDQNANMLGIVALSEALSKAEKAGLDLVEISPQGEPPVCKIMDFGKFKYESKRRLNDAKKKQKVISLKEMKFKLNIGQGDFDVKLRKIKEFLEEGDKVKVSLWFKGREIIHREIGNELFNRIIEILGDLAKIEQAPKMEGKQIIMIISPGAIKDAR
jgi:translation initiation factor IF-3